MKTRTQLTSAIDRLYKQADDLRLCIGLGDDGIDQQDELDVILARIDRLTVQLADHDARQAIWRANHVRGLTRYILKARGMVTA